MLFVWLVLIAKRQRLGFRRNAASVTAIAVYIGYCISILWAVDKGLSVWGIAKYLPIPLMALCLLYWKDALPVIGNHPFGLGYLGYYMSHGSFQTGQYSVRWVHNELLQMLLDIGWIPAVIAIVAVLVLGSLYIGVGSTLYYSGKTEASVKVYPWNTQARMELLTKAETAEEMDEQADAILSLNDTIALAWDARAEAAYSRGDFGAVIDAKNNALANTKYIRSEYVDYFNKLAVGYQLYLQAGDTKSAQICLDEIIGIQSRIDKVLSDTDPLAWKITDKPYLVMPDEYNEFVEAHK